jgi:hypothetical protein
LAFLDNRLLRSGLLRDYKNPPPHSLRTSQLNGSGKTGPLRKQAHIDSLQPFGHYLLSLFSGPFFGVSEEYRSI